MKTKSEKKLAELAAETRQALHSTYSIERESYKKKFGLDLDKLEDFKMVAIVLFQALTKDMFRKDRMMEAIKDALNQEED